MEAIQKGIKINEQYREAEKYAKKLEGIARSTNWYQTKVKYERARNVIEQRKKIHQQMQFGEMQLKRRRRVNLEELYKKDNQQYETELHDKGLVIYKTKI